MYFSELAVYFERIEKTPARLETTKILAELFQKLTPEEIKMTTYLLQGRVAPLYESIEFGMAEKTVIKSIVSALNVERAYFEKENKRVGDVGATVEEFKKQFISFEEKALTIHEVFLELKRLASASGDGSNDLKVGILAGLIRQLDPLSCRYLVRIPQGMLRLGFSDMTLLDVFSWMTVGSKEYRVDLQSAYQMRPDLGSLGKLIREKGIEGVRLVTPALFRPIIMMRAERLSSGAEIIDQIGTCAVEPKYDGFRLQIHCNATTGEVRLYSRNLEDVTHMYPDIALGVKLEAKGKEIILEGEAIGYNKEENIFLPFQDTVQRKRTYNIEEKAKEIPLRLFVFELLYFDGESYIHRPFSERRKKLESIISPKSTAKKNIVILAPHTLLSDPYEVEKSFDGAVEKGLEGIIAKKLDGLYRPGAREWNWIKFKRSYSSKIHDTVDCVVMGYDSGKGKRTNFGIGAFLVGVYDSVNDRYVTVSKIGTGLTDNEWREMKSRCEMVTIPKIHATYVVDQLMQVDVWVDPKIVVEIKADEITKSPVHTAGFALRFPRLVRFRDDKLPSDATTSLEISALYTKQEA